MLSLGILRGLPVLLWLIMAAAIAQSQNSRASSAASYLERSNQWLAEGYWDRAIADYDQALRLKPSWADGYGNRGLARLMQGELAEAEADFARFRSLGGSPKPEAEALLREMKGRGVAR
jgi:tetratricopeptide (TPR) repeat protein